nr:hypothetical protein [uncultured Acetatifactor sp.]
MGNKTREKKKMMEAVARHEAIRRQQEMREKPFRSVLYQGRKAVQAAQSRKGDR